MEISSIDPLISMLIVTASEPFFIGISVKAIIYFVIMCLLLLCSAMASSSETAYFSLQPNDISELEESSNRNEQLVLEIRQNPKNLLATILIANNLVNISITILSTYIMNMLFNMDVNPIAAFILNVVVVTSLILLVGEMIPKVYATKKAKAIATLMAPIIKVLMKLLKPLCIVFVRSTSFIDKRLVKKTGTISLSDLSTAVDIATEEGSSPEEKNMLKGIASFGEKEVSDIMRPRVDMFSLSMETTFEELMPQVIDKGFSRIPVYDKDLDDVKGMLYVKDLLPHLDDKNFGWQELIRPVFFVPENKRINDLFQDFRTKKIHIAIVVDEYGGTSGLVTLEDIVEEIVGDISDEFDKEPENEYYKKIDNDTYVFKAQISLIDFCRVFGINDDYFREIEGESDTLAGMILEMEGRIPEVGFKCNYKEYTFEIVESDKKRIIRIKVTRKNEE
ncbi:MAG: gliding motility-associated protein GldE [Bacteroidales bacterium]|nr:gliding motility-associated protein GldE [Bacteroidales bacterium]MBQ3595826.1 gliding motility-associated protein GldE [Bacteroidales bacterium]